MMKDLIKQAGAVSREGRHYISRVDNWMIPKFDMKPKENQHMSQVLFTRKRLFPPGAASGGSDSWRKGHGPGTTLSPVRSILRRLKWTH
jgi:hypothetical protein